MSQRNSTNKQKGSDGEYELAEELRSLGFASASRGSSKDIINTQPFHIECKNVRSGLILKWMWQSIRDALRFKQQGYSIPTVWMKYNDQWYVMVPVLNLRQFCVEILRKMRGK